MKSIVINPKERAVSSDINRLQQFIAADQSEAYRYTLNVGRGLDDYGAGSAAVETLTATSPASADVLGGLLVRPINASLNLQVDPGMIGIIDPTGDTADDSAYKVIESTGVATLGTLAIAPNTSGSTRFDLVECTRAPNQVLETTAREAFDPTTGLFVSAALPKVTADGLAFRVRQGVNISSTATFFATGAVPLAIVVVPSGASSLDACDLYDLRPLVSDRIAPPFKLGRRVPRQANALGVALSSTHAMLLGSVEANVQEEAIRLGGQIQSPGIDLNAAANWSGGVVVDGQGFVYIGAPFGLRWARYGTTGTREPLSPRGIVFVSTQHPDGSGRPSVAVALPAPFAAIVTQEAVCIGASTWASGACASFHANGRWVINPAFTSTATVSPSSGSFLLQVTPAGSGSFCYPGNARAVRILMDVSGNLGAGTQGSATPIARIQDTAGSVTYMSIPLGVRTESNGTSIPKPIQLQCEFEVPLSVILQGGFRVRLELSASYTINSCDCNLVGWKF